MKHRPISVAIALTLALAYSALIAAALDLLGPAPRLQAALVSGAAIEQLVDAPLAASNTADHSAMRLRMTLPYVPVGPTRVHVQEI
ncbi:hypothetical protein [Aquimonas sp.]|jgi:hypothetical protein|uniref:hypothetical protein n=1 Tax=Aquimonas sp. TaxID=1872588 RepID=UPI0037BFC8F1